MTRSYIIQYEETGVLSTMGDAYDVALAVNSDGHEFAYDDKKARGWESTPTEVNSDGHEFACDDNGRVTTYTDFDGAELGYTYDALGRPTSMSAYEQGNNYSYAYNAAGQLATITAPGSRVWNFQYNALGQRTQYTHPNGTRTEYAYDVRNRLTGIYHKNASTDAVLDSYVYTLNDGGAITRMDQADNSYWTYGYDQRNRLIGAARRNTQGSILHIFGYDYDAADNMTQRYRFQASNSQTDLWEYDYNTANEQIAMTLNAGTPETRSYDAWGRLATRAQGAYSATYGYRYGSRLYQATSNFPGESNVTYDYGGDGKRRWRVTAAETRRYRYDRGWNPIIEESTTNGLMANLFELGQAVGQRLAHVYGTLASGTYLYGYHDHLGSVRRWRLQNRNSARAVEYDAYGNPYAASGSWSVSNIYALHEFDTALRQYRAPWRDYSPAMARWTTPDLMGMVDGPNVFAYVRGNPVNMIDYTGEWALPVIIIIIPVAVLATWQAVCAKWAHDKTEGECNDKKRLCMVSCLTNRCSAFTASGTGAIASVLWEIIGGWQGSESWLDISASLDGILQSYDIRKSCETKCSKYDNKK